jgi:competence protein ComEA
MKTLWAVAFGVLFGLLAAGVLLLVARPPQGQAIQLLPAPTPQPLVVHVTGAVQQPGLCQIAPGSRVQDAIQAAGGLIPEAENAGLNLAAFVQDGDLIRVPFKAQDTAVEEAAPAPELPVRSGAPLSSESQTGLVNINTASEAELETLPGIGPVTAGKIAAHREEHGPFDSIEAIQDVSGIGPATFEKIKDLITVDGLP